MKTEIVTELQIIEASGSHWSDALKQDADKVINQMAIANLLKDKPDEDRSTNTK